MGIGTVQETAVWAQRVSHEMAFLVVNGYHLKYEMSSILIGLKVY